jgi:hypothetical protein
LKVKIPLGFDPIIVGIAFSFIIYSIKKN